MGLLAGEEGLLSLLSMTFRKFDIVRALFYLYCFWERKHQDTQRYRRQDVVWGGINTPTSIRGI